MEPLFISGDAIYALHEQLLEEHGGLPGDYGTVDSIAAYPMQKLAYQDPPPSIQELAAYYAYAAAVTHAFVDGNKRVALALMDIFLIQNGYELASSDAENEEVILALADGEIGEIDMVVWVTENAHPL